MSRNYKSFVGPSINYDRVAAMQFNLFTSLGLRQSHSFLDIGCGSLRAGKLLIPYLEHKRYVGIEPNDWLLDEGIKNEVGDSLIKIKSPEFHHFSDFKISRINRTFDYINAQSIFSHASQEQIETCLTEVKRIMNPNGIFAATFVVGRNNYQGNEWVYPDCVTYRTRFIKKIAKKAGLWTMKINWSHPNYQTWFIFCHPKNKNQTIKKIRSIHRFNTKSLVTSHDLNVIKQRLLRFRLIQTLNNLRKGNQLFK